jgi:hypothetical protein
MHLQRQNATVTPCIIGMGSKMNSLSAEDKGIFRFRSVCEVFVD